MVWLIILLAVAIAFVALWKTAKLERGPLELVGAGLVLAIAGYAWQGHAWFPGKPAAGEERGEQTRIGGETFAVMRRSVLGQFDRADTRLTMADSFLSRGDTLNAVGILRGGIRDNPRDPDLWIGLGNALQWHAEGKLTPAAEFAFGRARELAPGNPAPLFFYGQALAQAGRLGEAEAAWQSVLAALPPGTSWRPLVEERLALLAQVAGMVDAKQREMQESVTQPLNQP